MKPLIDADVLRYEIGFGAEAHWEDGLPPFDYVAEMLDNRINNICAVVGATEPPTLYLTGKNNFRYQIARTAPYKERPSAKPFHFKNLTAYMKGKYDWLESQGMEADDAMAIHATESYGRTVICTRDKDLRAVPGWQYGWEVHNQPEFRLQLVDELGWIDLSPGRDKLIGTGGLFFYGQCLVGDAVDSVPGLGRRTGPVKAFGILAGTTSLREGFNRVRQAYIEAWGVEEGLRRFLEQGQLLHMTRYLDEHGDPVLWRFPYD